MSENGQEPQHVDEPEAVGADQVEEGESQQQQKEEEEGGAEPAEQQATPEETPAQQQQEDSGAPEVAPAQQEDGEESAGGAGEGGEEKAAEGEGEGEKAEEGEGEAKQQPEGEGAKEDDEDAEPEEPQVEEEKITISHEDNPNWLSAEDCLAKGIPEESVSAFQNVYFQHAYTIKTWHAGLSDHAFQSEFITLSSDEVNVLLAASHPGPGDQPELSDEQKELLEQIETKLNEAIEKFEGDGGFIRINDRNPTDSILERNDAEFVAKVRDAVINEMEVEKQSADAYLIWRDQKHEGALRRGITRLRQSFRRQRTTSTSLPKKEGQPKLEDTTGEDGEKKEGEEATPAGEQTEEAAAAPEGGDGEKKEGEGEEGAAVTVEAEVQDAGGEQADSAPQPEVEQQTEEQPAAVEPAAEPEQQPEGEGGEEEAKKPEEGEKTEEGGGEKAEEGEGEKKEEEEIEKAPEQEEEPPKKEPPSKHKSGEHLPIRKLRPETLDNKILRAFGRALTAMYKASSGKEALDMILRSGLTKQYLEQVKSFGEVEGLSVTISVGRYNADIARYPGMVLRGFVYEGELTALSQKHDDISYFPNVVQYKNIIQHKVKQFYTEHVKEALAERGSYIIDLFVSTEKVFILRLSPFYTGIGACLYTWNEHAKILTQAPLDFKIIEASRRAPELYSGLQSQWNSMLDSVLQQKQNEHGPPGRTCTIL